MFILLAPTLSQLKLKGFSFSPLAVKIRLADLKNNFLNLMSCKNCCSKMRYETQQPSTTF